MDWYQNLYIGENIKKKRETEIKKIKHKLEKQKRLSGILLIILPPEEQNQLEIIQADQLYRYIRRGKSVYIIGLASDMGEAKELVRQMAEDVYQNCKHVQIKEYFMESFGIRS